jgi:hypothetical protein
MENEKKELLEAFRGLDPEIRADVLAHVRVAYAAQENTKKRYGLLPESNPAQNTGGKPAA